MDIFDGVLQFGPDIAERNETVSTLWGAEDVEFTREHIDALLQGKKVYFSVNCEYVAIITMKGADNETN